MLKKASSVIHSFSNNFIKNEKSDNSSGYVIDININSKTDTKNNNDELFKYISSLVEQNSKLQQDIDNLKKQVEKHEKIENSFLKSASRVNNVVLGVVIFFPITIVIAVALIYYVMEMNGVLVSDGTFFDLIINLIGAVGLLEIIALPLSFRYITKRLDELEGFGKLD